MKNPLEMLLQLEKECTVSLCLPKDLYVLYYDPLRNRLANWFSGFFIAAEAPTQETSTSADYHLSLLTESPSQGPALTFPALEGAPTTEEMAPFVRKPAQWTVVEERYLSLQNKINSQNERSGFQQLLSQWWQLRNHMQTLELIRKAHANLITEIQNQDQQYYQGLGLLLIEAAEKALQLSVMGKVMKRYIKILIIDDLGERTSARLSELGFSKHNVSTMSLDTFRRNYEAFQAQYSEQFKEQTVSLDDFWKRCDLFENHEIIIYNPWEFRNNQLLVEIRIRRKPVLSRKEFIRSHENPEKRTTQIETLKEQCLTFKGRLKLIEDQLNLAETEDSLRSFEYQNLRRQWKLLQSDLTQAIQKLKTEQKTINANIDLLGYTRDLMNTVQGNQSLAQKLGKKLGQWHGLDDWLMGADNKEETGSWESLVQLIHTKEKHEKDIRNQKLQIDSELQVFSEIGQQHFAEVKDHQQLIGVHILNVLEQSITGCALSHTKQFLHHYPGAYYQVELGDENPLVWTDPLLSKVRIFVLTRSYRIPSQVFQHLFRINDNEVLQRIWISPELPESGDFDVGESDLFVVDCSSFSSKEIAESLKRRNSSSRAHIPFILLMPPHYEISPANQMKLELLIGLKSASPGVMMFQTPSYQVSNLTDYQLLIPVLCEVMGIAIETVPSFEKSQAHLNAKENATEGKVELPFIPHLDDEKESQSAPNKTPSPAKHLSSHRPGDSNLDQRGDEALARRESSDITETEKIVKFKRLQPETPEILYRVDQLFAFEDLQEGEPPSQPSSETSEQDFAISSVLIFEDVDNEDEAPPDLQKEDKVYPLGQLFKF
ncbi:hypothetical protein WDW89_05565 [Deltaproteobacteria bacterium TL4]